MEGFYSHLSCISRIFRPECSFDRQESHESLYRLPISLPHVPGPRDVGTDSADSQRSMTTKQKHGYHPLQHEPAFPDDKFKAAAGLSCMLSVGA